MLFGGVADVWRAYRRQGWRIAVLQLLAILGVSVVIAIVALIAQGSLAQVMAYLAADVQQLEGRAAAIAYALIAGVTLLTVPFFVASAAATAEVVDSALTVRRGRLWRALGRGFARLLPILGVVVVAFLLVLLSLVAAPFIVVAGVLGLAVTGVIALVRRRRPEVLPTWPGWRTWGFASIPFAWFARLTATAMLMFPAAVLEPAGPLRAYRAADRLAVGRRVPILVIMAIAFVLGIGLSAGATLLGSALWGDVGATLLGTLVQFVALPLPIVAAVALYRRAAGPSGRVYETAAAPVPARRAVSPAMARVATAVVGILVLSTALVPVPGAVSAASADPLNAGLDVSYVVTSGVDTLDAGQLALQQASCAAAGPDCTIRAALLRAAGDAGDGAHSVTIGFADDMDIAVAGTLEFLPAGGAAGTLYLDSNGHSVVLDGGSTAQIMRTQSETWELSIAGLQFRNGSAEAGGALSSGQPLTTLTSVVFSDNRAQSAGGAVLAQRLTVIDSTFLSNRATANGALGGAIYSAGATQVVNSTFYGSQLGGGENPIYGNGSDVYVASGILTVVNSTLVDFRGGSLESASGGVVRNSLFVASGGEFACIGPFTGGANIHSRGDASCPSTGVAATSLVDSELDYSGTVPVFPLLATSNPALGAGTDCPAYDALGSARPTTGCDLGAVELPTSVTATTVEAIPDPQFVGIVTFKAIVSGGAAAPVGTVVFTVDNVVQSPVAVTPVGDGTSSASIQISNLTLGASYGYSAAFTPSGAWDPSETGPLSYTVEPIPVPVDLLCTPPNSVECGGQTWTISESGSISLKATVTDDRAGTTVIALDPEGDDVFAGPETVVDGVATFTIPASAFGLGSFPTLHAIYTSDDGQHAGVSSVAHALQVLRAPTVTISGLPASGLYGDASTGTATVTVTGAGATPTGTVKILGWQGTLDANGQAAIDVSTVFVGSGTVGLTADYLGDSVYGPGTSSAVDFHTTVVTTSTEITDISPAAPQYGESVTVTVTVRSLAPSTAAPQGNVTLTVDGTEVFGPISFDPLAQERDGDMTFEAVIPAAALGAGDHALLAEYAGNDNFLDSSSTGALSITKAPTSTGLVVAPTSSVFGDQVTLTATVDASGTASPANGSVTFAAGASSLGTVALVPCGTGDCSVASLTVAASTIGVGTATLKAQYQGSANFAASMATSGSYVVSKAAPTVSVSGASTLVFGHSADYTVAVGTLRAKPADGSTVVMTAVPATGATVALGTVSLTDGTATASVAGLAPGDYTITAVYAGDSQFLAATGSTPVTVTAASTDIDLDSISGTTVTYGETLDVVLTVKNTSGSDAPEGDVVVTWAGWEVGRVTLSAADDNGAGIRTVHVPALFGLQIPMQSPTWLTANFEPADGFSASHLSVASPDERVTVTLRPLTTTVSIDTSVVLGLPVAATATVDAEGDLGVVPGGSVLFRVNKSGGGSVDIGPVALVNGQATLDQALGLSPDIIVDLAGTWSVRAIYYKDGDARYSSTSPDDTAIKSTDVQPGGVLITATAPAAPGFGSPVSVHVTVSGATTPTGKARIQLSGTGNVLVSDEVTLVNGQADITIDPAWLTITSRDYVVRYLGDGTYNSGSSAPFTIAVGPTTTTTTVSTSSQVLTLYPGMLGGIVQYGAHVTAVTGAATGIVTFYRDTTVIGTGIVDGNGDVSMTTVVDQVWSGTISAKFQPYSGDYATSTGTLAHSWVRPDVKVTMFGPASANVGVASTYTAQVYFDFTNYQYLQAAQLPPHAPSGTITISDGAGTTCTALLVEVNSASAQADCSVQFVGAGTRSLTASYAGESGAWAAGTSTAYNVTVGKGTPTLSVATPDGDIWKGLSTIPVSWQVQGPTDGTVTIKRGATTVCTSTSMTGSCNVAIPAWDRAVNGSTFTIEYGGNTLWKTGTTTKTGTIDACVPFAASTSNPAGSSTVNIAPAPTCNGGTGYYTSDSVIVAAQPTAGYTVTGFSGGAGLVYPTADISFAGGGASMTVHPALRFSGDVVPFRIQANATADCVSVRFRTTGISDQAVARSLILWDAPGNTCSAPITFSGDSFTASVSTGNQVRVAIQTRAIPAGKKFYAWDNLQTGDQYASSAVYTVTPQNNEITADFGNICYSNGPTVVQPVDGTITLNLPAPNCTDTGAGIQGWVQGTPGTATLVDSVSSTRQIVSTRYGSLNGKYQAIYEYGMVPSKPVYFDSWRGDTGSFTVGANATITDASGAQRQSHNISFTLGTKPFLIQAAYGGCAVLTTAIAGDKTDGTPGTVSMDTPGNCPISAGVGATRWYKTGTAVTLTATAATKALKFMGWTGIPLPAARVPDSSVTFPITASATATAAFGSNGNCRPITVAAIPSSVISLTTNYGLGPNACEALYGPKFYDQGVDGNVANFEANLTGAAVGAQVVFQWATNPPGVSSAANQGISNIWTRGGSLQQEIYGDTSIIAYACEFVQIGAAVYQPNGQLVDGTQPGSGAANTDPNTQDQLEDYLITQPADCANGSDPKSHYGGYAWLVGTQLKPIQVADPAAYRFTGWSGDVKGTGTSPDAALTLAGAGHAAEGDSYNFHVTANFEAICYELKPSGSALQETLTDPNCPYTVAGKNLYLGGTPVILHATDSKGLVFLGWNGVDAVDGDAHWASVTMTSDKTASPSYRRTTAGEDVTSVATAVGDSLAIASKKMVGVISATVAAYAKEVLSKATLAADALGYVAQGLEAVGVHGAAIDGMKSMSTMMNNVIGLLWAPMDCITAWSAGGEDTIFYAAQNAIGTAVVTYMTLNAQKLEEQVVTPVSTWDKLVAQATSVADKLAKKAEPAVTAATALAQAKKVYTASQGGALGWEDSAYDAWGSQASVSVYTSCMANRVATAGDSVSTVAP
ncbi:hypothetical protein BH11ACT5_BH11ACT5_22460 [soil metagenome]